MASCYASSSLVGALHGTIGLTASDAPPTKPRSESLELILVCADVANILYLASEIEVGTAQSIISFLLR